MKIIFVTGGVLSGLGKGIAAASIGHLLSYNYKVVPIKCDGYLNVDPGTINPFEHGEVFVLEDGAETDMDFGHYERFLGISCTRNMSLTMGKVYQGVIAKERRGDYLGEDVQLIPHVTNYIKQHWLATAADADVLIIEIGGTVGDMESDLFLEAARQLRRERGRDNAIFMHLTYVPKPASIGEQKTKPTQQSVQLLLQRGIVPDAIITRSEEPVSDALKEKIKLFCGVDTVISGHDISDLYRVPQNFQEQGMITYLNDRLGLHATHDVCRWSKSLHDSNATESVTIGIAGKYTSIGDSYASITEALKHSGAATHTQINIRWIDTVAIHTLADAQEQLRGVDAVIVPGGFGSRGVEGKILIIQCCREQDIPYLGICYGMQLAVVEFARNVCGLAKANTTEIDPSTAHPVIDILPEQVNVHAKGGTMRLGSYAAPIESGTRMHQLYGSEASERHRHRYEVNPSYHATLKEHGMLFPGMSHDSVLAEFMELPSKRYFVGTQAHPELKSSLEKPAPLFLGLVKAALALREQTH